MVILWHTYNYRFRVCATKTKTEKIVCEHWKSYAWRLQRKLKLPKSWYRNATQQSTVLCGKIIQLRTMNTIQYIQIENVGHKPHKYGRKQIERKIEKKRKKKKTKHFEHRIFVWKLLDMYRFGGSLSHWQSATTSAMCDCRLAADRVTGRGDYFRGWRCLFLIVIAVIVFVFVIIASYIVRWMWLILI